MSLPDREHAESVSAAAEAAEISERHRVNQIAHTAISKKWLKWINHPGRVSDEEHIKLAVAAMEASESSQHYINTPIRKKNE